MSKRTLALILFLLVVTGVLLAKAISPKPVVPPVAIQPTVTPVVGNTILTLYPNPLAVSSSSGSIDVNIDTGTDKVTGVQLEMKYDPEVLTITGTSITPGTFFDSPTILRNSVDQKNGAISYALFIPLSAQPKTGIGTVAKISFQANRTVAKQTVLSLTQKSLVTAEGIAPSVLKNVTDAVIIFTETTTTP